MSARERPVCNVLCNKHSGNVFIGEGWLEVESPDEEVKLIQVSVGVNSVWAVTADRRVWFRKGIKGETAASDELARGSGWVEMVGDMSLVSVAPNDQVNSATEFC